MLISKKYLGKNLVYLRKKAGLKQSEIYDRLGIRATTWGMYEIDRSQPNLDVLIHISKYFGVTETDLLHKDLSQIGNLIEKSDDQKNQEKGKLISNPIGKVKTQKEGKSPPPYNFEMPFNQALNDPETPYGILHQQIHEISSKIATLEANMSKRIAQMEDEIKFLSKSSTTK